MQSSRRDWISRRDERKHSVGDGGNRSRMDDGGQCWSLALDVNHHVHGYTYFPISRTFTIAAYHHLVNTDG